MHKLTMFRHAVGSLRGSERTVAELRSADSLPVGVR